jgi:hypothetical protein
VALSCSPVSELCRSSAHNQPLSMWGPLPAHLLHACRVLAGALPKTRLILVGNSKRRQRVASMCTGGKLIVLYGGLSRAAQQGGVSHDITGREVAVLNLETMSWDRPSEWRSALHLSLRLLLV